MTVEYVIAVCGAFLFLIFLYFQLVLIQIYGMLLGVDIYADIQARFKRKAPK